MNKTAKLIEGHKAIAPPTGVPVWDVDPYSPEVLLNPAPHYAVLRNGGPFAYVPQYSMLACGRYAENKEVFSDWQRFVSSRGVGLQDFSLEPPWRPASIVLEVDPPYHTRTRSVILRCMSPKAVAAVRENFTLEADRLVDELLADKAFDAIPKLAEVYPATVFPAAVGLRQPDKRKLVDYGSMVFNALGPDNDLRKSAMAKGGEIVPWILQQCKRENLTENGFGATIYQAVDQGEISEDEAGMLVRSLLSAGIDTTVNMIGSALWCLANNPEQFDKLKYNPELARKAVEETMRFTSPVQAFCRTANEDTSVSGIDIEAGTKILCVLASANLDENHWPHADKFDIDRNTAGHLALGVGIHACVGQNVARAEGTAILRAIAEKVDTIKLAGEAVWQPNNAVRGLKSLPISFEAK